MTEAVRGEPIKGAFFNRSADAVARDLIGVTLLLNQIGGIIVETEAYDEGDCAAHCFNRHEPDKPWRTALNNSMFLPGGYAYVCPGRHLLHLNFVCGDTDKPSAVLIRAIRPLEQCIEEIRKRREPNFDKAPSNRALCAGPGCVGESLAVRCEYDGKSLYEPPFQLYAREHEIAVCRGKRVGTQSDRKRRYIWKDCPYVSKKMDDSELIS